MSHSFPNPSLQAFPHLCLALDTSTSQGGVAVLREDQTLASRTWSREGSHGEHLTSKIEDALNEAGIAASEINVVAVGQGPGSFTGIRIAINGARTIAFTNSARAFAFDTTEILANGCGERSEPVLALVNAQKNLVFASIFVYERSTQSWIRNGALEVLSLEQLESRITSNHLCVGDGFLEYEALMPAELKNRLVRDSSVSDFPSPIILGQMAWKRRNSGQPLVWNDLQPLYIRASGAEEKLRESGKN